MNKRNCAGCRDDFYNHTDMGLNMDGGEPKCWSLKSAKLVMRRRVHINDAPPWTNKPERLPDCYKQKGYIFVAPDRSR